MTFLSNAVFLSGISVIAVVFFIIIFATLKA